MFWFIKGCKFSLRVHPHAMSDILRYMLSTKHFLYLGVHKTLHSPSWTTSTPDTFWPPSVTRPPIRPSPRTVVRSVLPPRHSPHPSQAPHPSLAPSVVPPRSSNNTVTKRPQKPCAALRESVSALKKQKRAHDPETAAMLANCDIPCEDQEQEPPKNALKKASKKVEMNKSFFTALSRGVTVRGTSFFFQC